MIMPDKSKSTGSNGVLLLGFTIPDELAKEIFLLDKSPQIATTKFAWRLARALKFGFTNIVLASVVPIKNYPHGKRIIFRSSEFVQNQTPGILLGFVNIVLIKHISRLFQCIFRLPEFMRRHNVDTIIVHGTHTPFMVFAIVMKLWGKKVFILLSDQHGVPSPSDHWYDRLLKKADTQIMAKLLGQFDGYICLSNAFREKFNFDKRVLVFPGILNGTIMTALGADVTQSKGKDTFKVVFAGGVNKSNGVDLLLEAFTLANNKGLSLIIYGEGELKEKVIAASLIDPRIIYGGLLFDGDMIEALASASLLINPRPPDQEYAQTSFPSKLMEYLAVGAPVLSTRIVSIPPEIEDCFFYIDDATAVGIAGSIRRVYQLPAEEREKIAGRAQQKVQKFYSEAIIGRKIASFIGEKFEMDDDKFNRSG